MTGYDGPIKNTDLLNLREYVTADTGSLNKADSTVLLMCTHSNLKARFMEIRFDRYVSCGSHKRVTLVPLDERTFTTSDLRSALFPEPSRAVLS